MKTLIIATAAAIALAAGLSACKKKGPAEEAGESLDKAAENIKDAVNPKGPAEKAGEKVDKALDN